jgi:hypothetical protein
MDQCLSEVYAKRKKENVDIQSIIPKMEIPFSQGQTKMECKKSTR